MNFKSAVEILREQFANSYSEWNYGLLQPVSIRMKIYNTEKKLQAQGTIRPTVVEESFFTSDLCSNQEEIETLKALEKNLKRKVAINVNGVCIYCEDVLRFNGFVVVPSLNLQYDFIML
jgi:hypothetical protein